LYLYDIKIQTNIKQNLVKKYARKSQFFQKNFFNFFFFFNWVGLGPTILTVEDLSIAEQWRTKMKKKKEEGGS